MIEAESHEWAQALREKMLTLERVFSWPDQVVVEIFKSLPAKSQAFALSGMKDEQKAKITPFYSPAEQRRLNDVLTESKPKPEEVQATLFKLVEMARKMITERELNPEKFDASLIIPEDFENKLEASASAKVSADVSAAAEAAVNAASSGATGAGAQAGSGSGANHSAEILQLQRTLGTVLKENKALKDEVRNLQGRLEQIRKIA